MRQLSMFVALVVPCTPLLFAGPQEEHVHSTGEQEHHGHDHDAASDHRFDDVEHWAKVFDSPERDEWQKPDEVIGFLSIEQGQVVADVGAGTGYFTVRLARALGPDGKVYAVDIEPELIDHIAQRAETAGLRQVIPVLGEPDDPKLPEAGVDLVFICNTWHHIDARLDYLSRLQPVLRPAGRVAVVDFKEGELPVGPPPEGKLTRAEILAEFEEAGWTLASETDALPYQYIFVFTPPRTGS